MTDLVVAGLGPNGIALDLEAGKVYWTLPFRGQIRRANLDGTDVEDIATARLFPVSVALDRTNDKIYFTVADIAFGGEFPGGIQRANLDGSDLEDVIVTGRGTEPCGIALDVPAGKMYWTDPARGRIQRANLDGSNVEILVDGAGFARAIALDLPVEGIPTLSYWGLVVLTLGILTLAKLIQLRRVTAGKRAKVELSLPQSETRKGASRRAINAPEEYTPLRSRRGIPNVHETCRVTPGAGTATRPTAATRPVPSGTTCSLRREPCG